MASEQALHDGNGKPSMIGESTAVAGETKRVKVGTGGLQADLGTRLDQVNDAITNYPVSSSSTYIATATTTVVKTGAGHLARIVVGETAAGAITIYDNTAASGTILGVLKASIVEDTYEFNIAFATGLTIVTAGASKITVVWR